MFNLLRIFSNKEIAIYVIKYQHHPLFKTLKKVEAESRVLISIVRVNIVKASAEREIDRDLSITIDSFFIEIVAHLSKNKLATLFNLL